MKDSLTGKFLKGTISFPDKQRIKKQFCLRGHDTFSLGRDSRGTCIVCSRDKTKARRQDRNRVIVHRDQFCVNGHDTFIGGRFSGNSACKLCHRTIGAEYRKKNWIKVQKSNRKYRQTPEIIVRAKNRRDADPIVKLASLLRTRLTKVLKSKGFGKRVKLSQYLGCTLDDLKLHLEKQFAPGMTWDNNTPKGWHIDHIAPLSSATTEEQLYALCHHTNLQPLWAKDNLKKGSSVYTI